MDEEKLDSLENEHIVQRTIEEVIDTDSGEVVIADEFFAQSEKIIVDARNVADLGYKTDTPKFRCLYCEQGVKISGRKTENRSKLSYFFAHYKDSDECPIKTSLGKSLNEILADKFRGINEGEDHKRLKEFIANSLELENAEAKGVTNVKVEATFQNKDIMTNWRRPDISANFGDKSLVFELQLSTTFLSVVNDRDNFYRQHKTFIIWVFGSFILSSDWQKLMAKDIYYANKRNVFVIDEDAQNATKERKELILKCYWQIPKIINGKVEITWHSKLVSLDELTYDDEQYKVFYHDSDKDFYEAADPKEREIILEWEKAKEERWRLLIEKINKRDKNPEKTAKKAQEVAEMLQLQEHIWSNDIAIFPQKKYKKWGFVTSKGTKVIPFQYDEVEVFDGGLAKVAKNNKYGLINKKNQIVLPLEFTDVKVYENQNFFFKKDGKWGLIDNNGTQIISNIYTNIEDIEVEIQKTKSKTSHNPVFINDTNSDNENKSYLKETNQELILDLGNSISIEMILVESGTFMMGADNGRTDGKSIHQVSLDSFWIAKYPTTQVQWQAITGNNPSRFIGDNLPTENVSWEETQEFINKINEKFNLSSATRKYRLPTEAEWEYAARGGNKSKGYEYAGADNIDEVAWYSGNSNHKTHPVGQKKPNELGIYDMSGNVWEWCNDWYARDYYRNSIKKPKENPKGAKAGSFRICRGGSWFNLPQPCRVASRGGNPPGDRDSRLGFRVCLPVR